MSQSVNTSENEVGNKEVEGNVDSQTSTGISFESLGVPERIAKVLTAQGKATAFPIQEDTLPDTLAGKDVLGRGETGSGKTLAYAIPLVTRLGEELISDDAPKGGNPVRALVLAPTRELVNQIDEVIKPLAAAYGMKTTTIFGGVRYQKQINELRGGAQIVLACPGRLEDLLNQRALSLDAVTITVLDEADLMADLGFLPAVNRLLKQIPEGGQHLFFSATLDHGIDTLVKRYLHNAKIHEIDAVNAHVETMTQHVFEVTSSEKPALIETLASGQGKRILFTRTKHQAQHLADKLTKSGIPAAQLHGNLSQNQRDRNMAVFKSGAANVLVATDVAARGVDVPAVELVVQVDPPKEAKSFLHRSGRTARAGMSGDVVTLVTPDQRRDTRRMLRQAAIKTSAREVTSDSPEVLDLVGPQADYVSPKKLEQAMEEFTRALSKKRNAADRGNRSARSERRHGRNHDRYEHDRSGGRGGHNRHSSNDFHKDPHRTRSSHDERGTWHDDSSDENRSQRRSREFSDGRKYRDDRGFRGDDRNERRDRHNDRSRFERSDRRSNRSDDRRDDGYRSDRRHDRNDSDFGSGRRSGRANDRYDRYDRDEHRSQRSSSDFHGRSSRKSDSNPFSDRSASKGRRSGGHDFDRSGNRGSHRSSQRGGKRY